MSFPLGQVVITPKASQWLAASGLSAEALLSRHQSGDWGEISIAARQSNELGLHRSYSLQSTYLTDDGHQLNIYTRGDRAFTFVHVAPPKG